MPLEGLNTSNFHFYNNDSILFASSTYENDLPLDALFILSVKLYMWKNRRKDLMKHCKNLLPNVQTLLQLFSTLPSATPERTFSIHTRIKTQLR